MQFYEFNLLISPNMSEAEAESFVQKLESEIQKYGKIVSDKKVERRKLAYPVNNELEAWLYFLSLYPEASDKKILLESVEKVLNEDKNILRHMTIQKDTKKVEAAAKRSMERMKRMPREKPASFEGKTESEVKIEEKPKVQLEDIGQKLDEMLGE